MVCASPSSSSDEIVDVCKVCESARCYHHYFVVVVVFIIWSCCRCYCNCLLEIVPPGNIDAICQCKYFPFNQYNTNNKHKTKGINRNYNKNKSSNSNSGSCISRSTNNNNNSNNYYYYFCLYYMRNERRFYWMQRFIHKEETRNVKVFQKNKKENHTNTAKQNFNIN